MAHNKYSANFRFQSLPYCYPCQSPTTALPAPNFNTHQWLVHYNQVGQLPKTRPLVWWDPKWVCLEEVEEDQRKMKHGHVMGQRRLGRRAP